MPMSFGGVSKQKVATIIVAADGTGDVTDIQTGIDLLPAGGGVVYIREGTYTITAAITIPNDNISLMGSGKSTKIQTTSDVAIFSATDKAGITFESFYLYGAGIGNAANYGIDILRCDDNRIEGLWIENCGASGIRIHGTGGGAATCQRTFVSDCWIYDNFGHGIENGGFSNNSIVHSCGIYRNKGCGIYWYGAGDEVCNCIVNDNVQHGLRVEFGEEIDLLEIDFLVMTNLHQEIMTEFLSQQIRM